MEFNKNLNVVLDIDEVLTYISPPWMALMSQNYDYFSKYMDIPQKFNMEHDSIKVLLRTEFYLEKSFGKPCLTDGSLSQTEIDEFKKNYMSLYDNDSFYTKLCKPTKMFMVIKELMLTKYFNKVYFVSRCTGNNTTGKMDFIESTLGKEAMKLAEFHLLGINEKKSDYIKSLPLVDVIYDDELKNVIDIMENVPMSDRGIDIKIPLHGYNIPREEIFELAEKTGYGIQYYESIKGFNASTYMNFIKVEE